MINPRIEKEFNDQIKYEIASAYLYLSMAAWFDNVGWDGMGSWMKVQAQEEMVHAMKFYDNIKDREGKVMLQALEQPQTEWASPLEAFKEAYKHEQFVTSRIQTLAKVATEENDYISRPLIDWFLNEQIEEEASTSKIAQQLERIGSSTEGLTMLDRELGARVFTPPAKGE
jgi:ferritin